MLLPDEVWGVVLAFVDDPRPCALVCHSWTGQLRLAVPSGGLRALYTRLGLAPPFPGPGAVAVSTACGRCQTTPVPWFRWPFCVYSPTGAAPIAVERGADRVLLASLVRRHPTAQPDLRLEDRVMDREELRLLASRNPATHWSTNEADRDFELHVRLGFLMKAAIPGLEPDLWSEQLHESPPWLVGSRFYVALLRVSNTQLPLPRDFMSMLAAIELLDQAPGRKWSAVHGPGWHEGRLNQRFSLQASLARVSPSCVVVVDDGAIACVVWAGTRSGLVARAVRRPPSYVGSRCCACRGMPGWTVPPSDALPEEPFPLLAPLSNTERAHR